MLAAAAAGAELAFILAAEDMQKYSFNSTDWNSGSIISWVLSGDTWGDFVMQNHTLPQLGINLGCLIKKLASAQLCVKQWCCCGKVQGFEQEQVCRAASELSCAMQLTIAELLAWGRG